MYIHYLPIITNLNLVSINILLKCDFQYLFISLVIWHRPCKKGQINMFVSIKGTFYFGVYNYSVAVMVQWRFIASRVISAISGMNEIDVNLNTVNVLNNSIYQHSAYD